MSNFRIKQFEPFIKEEWANAIQRQIMSGELSPGKVTNICEELLCNIHNLEYLRMTSSGTTALYLVFKILKQKYGKLIGNVYIPSYSFIAAANAAKLAGLNVQVIDVDPETLCMDIEILEQTLIHNHNSFTVGIVVPICHNGYGAKGDFHFQRDIQSICGRYENIFTVYDMAQCVGLTDELLGDFGIFSFSVPKLVTGFQGGAIFCNEDIWKYEIDKILDHGADGWRQDKIHKNIGGNFRIDDIRSRYIIEQLKELKFLTDRKTHIYNEYKKHLGEFIFDNCDAFPWMIIYKGISKFHIDKVQENLYNKQIESIRYYRALCDNLSIQINPDECKVAKNLYNTLLYLPSSINLSDENIKEICEIIQK